MKKKLLSVILAAVMTVGMLSACGQSAEEAPAVQETETEQTEEAPAEEPAEAPEEAVQEEAESTEGIMTINGEKLTKIGLAVAALDNEFTTNLADSLEAAAAEYGVETVIAQADQTTAKQVEQIENMVVSGCQAICIVPVDLDGILDTLKAAKEKGVVISMCGCIPESKDYYDVVANVEQFLSLIHI